MCCTGVLDRCSRPKHACVSLIVVKCVVVIMRHDCAFCRVAAAARRQKKGRFLFLCVLLSIAAA